jgi:Glycosyltransferase WbsX
MDASGEMPEVVVDLAQGTVAPSGISDDLGETILEQERRIAVLERRLAAAERDVQIVVGSLSWRLTRPLRAAGSVVRVVLGTFRRWGSLVFMQLGGTHFAWALMSIFFPDRPRFLRLHKEGCVPYELGDRRLAAAAAASVRRGGSVEVVGETVDPFGGTSAVDQLRLIAFYLPQFHPIPENDQWWGRGFTEWTNARRARPQFRGHYQPQLPTELGYYDLRDPHVLDRQAELAGAYGVSGFCFYYYWFNGRRVLEKPIDVMLARSRPDLPFCLCWVNENWTRRWDGREDEVLLRQQYDGDRADRFIRDVLPALLDRRSIKVGDAPLLLVYRPLSMPEPRQVAGRWRSIAKAEAGIDLHLAAVQAYGLRDPSAVGFDAAVEFPPHVGRVHARAGNVKNLSPDFAGELLDYRGAVKALLGCSLPTYFWYRALMPSWDSTARRGSQGHEFLHSNPSEYRLWLRKLVYQTLLRSAVQPPFVFVNAWNEWAEGTHLEPDDRYGRAWLEATRDGLCDGIRQFHAYGGRRMTAHEALDRLELVTRCARGGRSATDVS